MVGCKSKAAGRSHSGLLTDGHFPCAAFCLLSCHRELLLRGDLPFNTSTGDLRSVHVRGLETGTIKEKKQTATPLTHLCVGFVFR